MKSRILRPPDQLRLFAMINKARSSTNEPALQHFHPVIESLATGETEPGRSVTIDFNDFLKVDIRVGTIVDAEAYPEARRPAYKLRVDFGNEIGVKKTSAQITRYYDLQTLPGRQVAAVVNFPPKQIGKFMSEVLVLGFPDADGEVVMVAIDHPVPNGGRLF
jgi:tRNA-binding protein